jgi:hypothetical protein
MPGTTFTQEARIAIALRMAPDGLSTETLAQRIGHKNTKSLAARMGRLVMYGKAVKAKTDSGVVWKSGE